jgi:peptidoglycan-associated lipoprotein
VSIENFNGSVELTGNRQVRPQTSTTYTAVAKGTGGISASPAVRITVNVQPPVNRPVATPIAQPAKTVSMSEQFSTLMQDVLFDYDKASIRAADEKQLEYEAQWLMKNPSVRFVIEGNADERGGQEYNIALGDDRAESVKGFLTAHGVALSRIETVSYGEERPLCSNEGETCWQKNRRAHFRMSAQGAP